MGLGSGIRDPEKPIPDPGSGSRGQKDTGSRIRNTALLTAGLILNIKTFSIYECNAVSDSIAERNLYIRSMFIQTIL